MIDKVIHDVVAYRVGLHPEDDFNTEKCWKQEITILTRDVTETISFFLNEATDDEVFWLSEVFEEIISDTQSAELLDALKRRAAKISDLETRNIVEREIDFAESDLLPN